MNQSEINTTVATETCDGRQKSFNLTSWPMLGFGTGCLCILAGYLLLTSIERGNYILRTVSLGTLVLLALSLHLLTRNALRDPFHPDILLTIGHLAQFVIPSLIFGTGFFNDILYSHAKQVRSFFPEMLLGVLIAQTAFNLPFCLRPPKKRQIPACTTSKLPVFIIFLAIGVWFSRLVILVTNSYYYHTSDFMKYSSFFSPVAVLSFLGRVITAYASLRFFEGKRGRDKVLPAIYLILEIGWHLSSGKREGLLIALLCIIFVYFFVRKKIPIGYVLCFLFVLFVGSVFLNYYRDVFLTAPSVDKISVIDASKIALREQKKISTKKTLNIVLDRLHDGQFAAGCFKSVPKHVPFQNGKTYKMILWIPVPSFLYHKRPKFMVNYNEIIRKEFVPPDTDNSIDEEVLEHSPITRYPGSESSAPITTVGEAYINFGWLGIAPVFLVLGLVYRLVDQLFTRHLSRVNAAILIFFCLLIVRIQVDPAVSHLSWMLKIIILLLTCRFFEFCFAFRRKTQTHN
ncbi:hypothetical protein ES703_90067 [subsurface metagenome]